MDKSALKKALLAIMENEQKLAGKDYKSYLKASMVDRSEPVDIDDQSQAGAAAEVAEALGVDSQNAENRLAHVERIDFGPKRSVSEGAVVTVDGKAYVVAVSTDAFTCQGHSITGISTLSPIYQAMEGLVAGDTFSLNGKSHKINGVL